MTRLLVSIWWHPFKILLIHGILVKKSMLVRVGAIRPSSIEDGSASTETSMIQRRDVNKLRVRQSCEQEYLPHLVLLVRSE